MPLLTLTLSGGSGKTNKWADVSTPLTQIQTLLNTTGLDHQNVQTNGLRPANMRAHAGLSSIGQKVRNDSGGALSANDLVYISGTYNDLTDNYPTVAKADSHATGTSNFFAVGLMDAAASNNTDATMRTSKEVSSLDTSGAVVGDPVYLSSTAGGWTLTRPTADEFLQVVGYVSVVNASTGRIVFDLTMPQEEWIVGSAGGLGIWLDVDQDAGIYAAADDDVRIRIAATDVVKVTATDVTITGNLTVTGTTTLSGTSVAMGDNDELRFGATPDYWLVYDLANTAFELNSTDTDGAGADGVIFDVQNGTNDVRMNGGLGIDGVAAPTAGLALTGAITNTADQTLTLGDLLTFNITAGTVDLTSSHTETTLFIDNTLADGDVVLAFQLSGTSVFSMGVDDGDSDKFKIGTTAIGTNTRLTIDSSGDVGIGNTTPNEAAFGAGVTVVSVKGSAADDFGAIELLAPDLTGTGRAGNIRFGNMDGGASIVSQADIRAFRDGADDAIALAFYTEATGAAMLEKVRFTSGGNVGIGTISPDHLLEIYGTGASAYGQLTANHANGYAIFQFENDVDAADAWGVGRWIDGKFYISYDSNATWGSGTGGATVVIDTSGNLGVNTATPVATFEIAGTAASPEANMKITEGTLNTTRLQIMSYDTDNTALSFDSFLNDAMTAWVSADAGSNFQIKKSSDKLNLNYDSGIAVGSSIAWNTGLTLDTSGNINIAGLTASQDVQTDGSKNLTSVSDMNWKNDRGPIYNALDLVKQIPAHYFDWKRDASGEVDLVDQPRLAGFFSQEVYEVFPEGSPGGANTDADGNEHWGLNARALLALAYKAIQELEAEVATLKKAA